MAELTSLLESYPCHVVDIFIFSLRSFLILSLGMFSSLYCLRYTSLRFFMLCTELLPIPNSIAASLSQFPASIYFISSIFFSRLISFLALGILRRDLKLFLCNNLFIFFIFFFYTVHGLINVYATTGVFILYIFSYFLYFILLSLFIYSPTFALYNFVLFHIFIFILLRFY